MDAAIFQYIAAAGDVGVWLVAYGFWRFDKRISWLEFKLSPES